LEDTLAFAKTLDDKDSATHPGKGKRIAAFTRGHFDAKRLASPIAMPVPITRGWWADLMVQRLPWLKP
jgi:hypothetical protein